MQPLLCWSWASTLPIPLTDRGLRPSTAVSCGQFLVFDAAAYRAAGGHIAVATRVTEDLEVARALRRAGHRTAVVAAGRIANTRITGAQPNSTPATPAGCGRPTDPRRAAPRWAPPPRSPTGRPRSPPCSAAAAPAASAYWGYACAVTGPGGAFAGVRRRPGTRGSCRPGPSGLGRRLPAPVVSLAPPAPGRPTHLEGTSRRRSRESVPGDAEPVPVVSPR